MSCQDAILHCSVQFAFLSSLAFFFIFRGPPRGKRNAKLDMANHGRHQFSDVLSQRFFCSEHVCDRFGRCAVEPLRLLRPFGFCRKFGQRFFNAASGPYNTLDSKVAIFQYGLWSFLFRFAAYPRMGSMVLNTFRRAARKQLQQEAAGKICLESPQG